MTQSHADLDVLIVGAGISGLSAAYYLQKECPDKRFSIVERREKIGGTWDLFRYPGIRSDSDMYTLGFRFKPWTSEKAIADAPSILTYLNETADEYGLRDKIEHGEKVVSAAFDSSAARWTVTLQNEANGETTTRTTKFLMMCSGYYNYDKGYMPEFPGAEQFGGQLIHPQHWPEDLDYAGKRVVVIGSGATAVTIVPEMAADAEHVTMLQRSPTYMASRPAIDGVANAMRKYLPGKLAYTLTRWRNVLFQMFFFKMARSKPEKVRETLLGQVKENLPEGYDIETHFTPRYNPWDERLCLVPDADLFDAIKARKADVETDHIETFTETGIQLKSGKHLDADIVVSATGLNLQFMGGADVSVDGKTVETGEVLMYRGMMYSDVPNLAATFGYTNASWTLKADLTSEFLCRVLKKMDKAGADIVVPRRESDDIELRPFVDFSSGYFKRAEAILPKQGAEKPWKLNQNYALDIMALRYGKLDDGVLQFEAAGRRETPETLDDSRLAAAE